MQGIGLGSIIRRKGNGEHECVTDEVAIEEPLEIRIAGATIATTMRTPGHDEELAAGFACLAHGVFVGYDTRFLSKQAARVAADTIAEAGIPVRLANDSVPTPSVSLAVKSHTGAGGVMLTSSHNPWNWNGVKFKAKFGGSATPLPGAPDWQGFSRAQWLGPASGRSGDAGSLTAKDLPVDAHELVALCAPRPVFVSVGSPEVEGNWVDDRGQFMAAVAAGPVAPPRGHAPPRALRRALAASGRL